MLEIISTRDLKLGMFVAELDRPWVGTPFALQGFLIANPRQVAVLQEYCSFVSIDRARSTFGESHIPPPPLRASVVAPGTGVLDVLRSVSKKAPAVSDPPARTGGIPNVLTVEEPGKTARARRVARVSPQNDPEPTSIRVPPPSPHMVSMGRVSTAKPQSRGRRGDGVLPDLIGVFDRPASPVHPLARTNIYVDRTNVEEEILASNELFGRTQELVRDISLEMSKDKLPEPERIREAVDEMVQSVLRNPDALIWLSKLKRTDDYSYDHALDVSIHLMAFGRHLGFPLDQLHTLGIAGLLQDVGKTKIPLSLLQKADPLTPAERAVLRRHSEYSAQLLESHPGTPPELLEIVARHHERTDGSGYPRHLKGEEIGIFAEMAGLVDTYCAMSYDRPYRPAMDNQKVLHKLYQARGKSFSEPLVIEFIQCVGLYPVGTLIQLRSGEVAVVVEQNRLRRLNPRILVLLHRDKSVISAPYLLDLKEDPQTEDGTPIRIAHALPAGSYGIDPTEFYL